MTTASCNTLFRRPLQFFSTLIAFVLFLGMTSAARAQNSPYMGVVDNEPATIRAGAGNTFYDVGTLPKGAVVTVHEVIFGWHKIAPPEGSTSYISKAFVNAVGDGSKGQVVAERAPVKAAGKNMAAKDCWRTQVVLNDGATVTILDEEDGFYEIEPPAGAFVYLPPASIRRATAEEIQAHREKQNPRQQPAQPQQTPEQTPRPQPTPEQPRPQQPAPTQPQVETPERPQPDTTPAPAPEQPQPQAPAEDETDGESPQTPAETQTPAPRDNAVQQPIEQQPETESQPQQEADNTPAAAPSQKIMGRALDVPAARSEALQALETRMKAVETQALVDQPIQELLAEYNTLKNTADLPILDQQIIALRIRQLERNRQIVQMLGKIDTIETQVQQESTRTVPQRPRANEYVIVGRLYTSTVYNGENLPRMYRLVEPSDHRTLAYVHPGDQINPSAMVGKLVGIMGTKRYDSSLKLYVIDVEAVDVLEAREAGQTPPTTLGETEDK